MARLRNSLACLTLTACLGPAGEAGTPPAGGELDSGENASDIAWTDNADHASSDSTDTFPDDADSTDGSDALASGGACTNAPDTVRLDASSLRAMDEATRACVLPRVLGGTTPSSPDFVEKVARCVTDDTGLSVACSTCHAELAACAFDACRTKCITNSMSDGCRECRCGRDETPDCMAAFERCTGRPTGYCLADEG